MKSHVAMYWLDTQTKEILQKSRVHDMAPPKAAEFALILLRKGGDQRRLIGAVAEIKKCSESNARATVSRELPLTLDPGLTEGEALWGQFQLICCDAISIFIRSEVLVQNERGYLWPLYQKVLHSPEFSPVRVKLNKVPPTESGEKFLEQFLGDFSSTSALPLTLSIPFKKARIMEHWATRIGAQLKLNVSKE